MKENAFENLPEDLQQALLRCDELADARQLEYFYQLYDPKTGGFYYSISSRDAEEMTPFAEGTSFTLEALLYGGIELPEWYKEKVSKWIQGHQDETDGFFYEDLWGKITSGSRIYRDIAYSRDILGKCGVNALYTFPEDRIKSGESASINSAGFPEHLESKEKMKAYLDSLDWSSKSIWGTGQRLTNESVVLKAAGLYEFTHDYILSKQNPETGLWGEGLGWMNTNGAMKLSSYFTDPAYPFPNPERAFESVKKLYEGDVPPTSATWIWNPFVLMSRILGNSGDNAEKLRNILLDTGADIVNKAVDCALLMKREDGGFSSSIGAAISRQQGYLFGYGKRTESDLDGTLIAGPRLRNFIWSVFGVKAPGGYYADKCEEFWERCKNKPEIVKTLPRPEGPLNPPGAQTHIFKPVW